MPPLFLAECLEVGFLDGGENYADAQPVGLVHEFVKVRLRHEGSPSRRSARTRSLWDDQGVWEDERAPLWRRRLLLWRSLAAVLLGLAIAASAVLFVSNSGWAFLVWVCCAAGCIAAFSRAGTYAGRLERTRRKAAARARKVKARARRHALSKK